MYRAWEGEPLALSPEVILDPVESRKQKILILLRLTRLIIQKGNSIPGKEKKVHSSPKEISMERISKQKMHTIFVRKDFGSEVRRKEKKLNKN